MQHAQAAPFAHALPNNPGNVSPTRGAQIRASAEWYSGQVPHPEHAERYEALLPGCTNRFVTMAEDQGKHRRFMEKISLVVHAFSQVGGVLIAGAAVLFGLWISYQLAVQGKDIKTWITGLAPLATVGGIFLYDRRSLRKEAERKRTAERG